MCLNGPRAEHGRCINPLDHRTTRHRGPSLHQKRKRMPHRIYFEGPADGRVEEEQTIDEKGSGTVRDVDVVARRRVSHDASYAVTLLATPCARPYFAFDPSTRRASSTLTFSCCSDSRRIRSSLLSISSIMPVIFPASSGWYLAIMGNNFSPIICFCTEGGAAASADAESGAPAPPACGCAGGAAAGRGICCGIMPGIMPGMPPLPGMPP